MTAKDEQEFDSRMRSAVEQAVAMFSSAQEGFEVAEENQIRFQVVWPCVAHAIHQAKSVLLLVDAGEFFTAEVNARSCLEHALVAQWVILTEGGHEDVVRETQRQWRAKLVDVMTFMSLPEDLQPGETVSSSGPARKFEQLCRRFSPPLDSNFTDANRKKSLYTMYRNLSGAMHPSTATWEQYLTADESGISGLRMAGKPGLGMDLMPATAIGAVLAMSALEELRLGQPRLVQLRLIAEAHGLPASLRGDDQEPERQPVLVFNADTND